MTSPVHWALLGLVIEEPSYGMEFYRRYESKYGDVLPISESSHIYTGLKELERRGFVEELWAGVGRQPKPRYRATRSGVRSYIERLVEQADVERDRPELWVRQLGAFVHEPAVALDVIERFERRYLKGAGSTESQSHDTASDAHELIDNLVVDRQHLAEGEMVTWLQHAHDGFEALANKAQADAPPRA
jgi:DNA-binding PadR family transcriptional regulator